MKGLRKLGTHLGSSYLQVAGFPSLVLVIACLQLSSPFPAHVICCTGSASASF